MPKNGQNDLKFEHNMHYGDSNCFLKFWQNLPKNVDLMAKKQAFLKFDGSIFLKTLFEHSATHKMAKTPNILKILLISIRSTLRYIQTKN